MPTASTHNGICWAADSNLGLMHRTNEDYYLIRPDLGLWVLCDGLSGHMEGESASWVCAMTIADNVAGNVDLVSAIHHAHWKVWRLTYNKSRTFNQCGTTVAALMIRKKKWQVAWVGDTRVWCYEKKKMVQITQDHTVARQLLNWGEINAEEAGRHPDRHRLTQVVGIGEKSLNVGSATGRWDGGQTFLLATDGLAYWNDPGKLALILEEAEHPGQAVSLLTRASIETWAKDDFTIIVVGPDLRTGFQPGKVLKNWLNSRRLAGR
ncbi:MAG: PP2C family protein-serine/threonine phosphatase [Thermodesulfobacteriota bacterium]